jgi:imidazolonepropionase-like amidohydrolase
MKTSTLISLLAPVLALAIHALAQDLTPRPPAQARAVVITGATVYPIDAEPIEDGVVVMDGGRITHVGPAGSLRTVAVPRDAERIDATGKRVYPGLFAAGTILGLTEVSSVRATRDYDETGPMTPEVRANVAINPDSTLVPVTRLGGVLLAGVSPTGGRVPGRLSVIRLDGWTWEDMTVDDAAGLALTWQRTRPIQRWFPEEPTEAEAERIEESRRALDAFFDAAEAYGSMPDPPERDERFEAMRPFVAPASEAERRPIHVRANDVDQITEAVTWCAERGYDAVIVGGRDAELCADLLLEYDVPVVLQGVHRYPKRADSGYDEAFNQPARLAAMGIRFAMSSSDRDGNLRNLPHEAALARRHGLSEADTLRAITLTPAEIHGVADRYGSLEPGKSATLFICDGDVLEVTSRVERLFIDGRELPMRSKQTDLLDKYVEKYRQLGLID